MLRAIPVGRPLVGPAGTSPFARWLRALNVLAAAKVTTLEHLEDGNISNIKPAGSGAPEYRIDFRIRLPHLLRERRRFGS